MAKDFRKKTFQKILRGYAPEEVEEYLAYVTEEYRKLERRNAENERKLVLALKKLDEQQKSEEQLGQQKIDEAYMQAVHEAEALLAEAETSAAHIREAAAAEAEKQLAEAAETAKALLDAAEADARRAKHEAAGIYDAASEMYEEVVSFRDSLFSLYNTHIENIESISESAKSYIDGVDGKYSAATGENVSHDEDDIDEDEEDGTDDDNAASDSDEAVGDIVPEAESEEADSAPAENGSRDVYIDPFDEDGDADEEFFGEENGDDSVIQIDWKRRRVIGAEEDESEGFAEETRVLDLKAVRDAAGDGTDFDEEELFDFPDDEGFEELADDDTVPDESDDFEEPSDYDEIGKAFGDMDSLFTEDKSGQNLSLTDEFDIVFSGADSRKNVEEIRRQPIVPADEPKKAKKHKKF